MPEMNKCQFHSFFNNSPTVHPKGSLQSLGLWSTAYGCGLDFLYKFSFAYFSFIGFLSKGGAKVLLLFHICVSEF